MRHVSQDDGVAAGDDESHRYRRGLVFELPQWNDRQGQAVVPHRDDRILRYVPQDDRLDAGVDESLGYCAGDLHYLSRRNFGQRQTLLAHFNDVVM